MANFCEIPRNFSEILQKFCSIPRNSSRISGSRKSFSGSCFFFTHELFSPCPSGASVGFVVSFPSCRSCGQPGPVWLAKPVQLAMGQWVSPPWKNQDSYLDVEGLHFLWHRWSSTETVRLNKGDIKHGAGVFHTMTYDEWTTRQGQEHGQWRCGGGWWKKNRVIYET